LAALESLRELSLAELPRLTDRGLDHVAGRTRLTRLQLSGTRVTDAGLTRLAPLTALQSLGLSGTQLSGETLAVLRGCTDLH